MTSKRRSQSEYKALKSIPVDALVIVDMQNGFLKDRTALITNVRDLVQSFPAERTWWLKYRNYPGSPFTKRLHWGEVMVSPETDIESSLLPFATKVMEHESYDPPEELAEALKGCQHVAIAGTDTDACIQATAFFLWRHRIYPVILQDHCRSSGGEHFHRVALDLMRRQFGVDAIAASIVPTMVARQVAQRASDSALPD